MRQPCAPTSARQRSSPFPPMTVESECCKAIPGKLNSSFRHCGPSRLFRKPTSTSRTALQSRPCKTALRRSACRLPVEQSLQGGCETVPRSDSGLCEAVQRRFADRLEPYMLCPNATRSKTRHSRGFHVNLCPLFGMGTDEWDKRAREATVQRGPFNHDGFWVDPKIRGCRNPGRGVHILNQAMGSTDKCQVLTFDYLTGLYKQQASHDRNLVPKRCAKE